MITHVILDQQGFDPTDPDEANLANIDAVTDKGWTYTIEADLSDPPDTWFIAFVHFPANSDPYRLFTDDPDEVMMELPVTFLPQPFRDQFIEDLLNAPVTEWYSFKPPFTP